MEKSILGFEHYTIDSFGNVFNTKRNKYVKPFVNKYGYPAIYLSKNGKRKHFLIHRLVAIAFIENPRGYKEINHKDENPSNPRVENLEWCDRTYNNNYGSRLAKISKRVVCVETGVVFSSVRDAERKTGVKAPSICYVCSGKRKSAGGYTWSFC